MFDIKKFIRGYGLRSAKKRLNMTQYMSRQFCYIHDYDGKAYVWVHDIPVFMIAEKSDVDADILDLKAAQDFVSRARLKFVKQHNDDSTRHSAACL